MVGRNAKADFGRGLSWGDAVEDHLTEVALVRVFRGRVAAFAQGEAGDGFGDGVSDASEAVTDPSSCFRDSLLGEVSGVVLEGRCEGPASSRTARYGEGSASLSRVERVDSHAFGQGSLFGREGRAGYSWQVRRVAIHRMRVARWISEVKADLTT